MNKETFKFKNKTYPIVELTDFDTVDCCYVEWGLFTSEDFIDADDNSLVYGIIDDEMYGYLPRNLLENGTESEIKEYIAKNIG